MNFLNRATKSIKRQFGKNIILLILIFILGSIIAGAMLVEGTIGATKANLRRRMPSIVSIGVDEERVIEEYLSSGEPPEFGMITADFVREIGKLPYVRDFSYSISVSLESFDLRSYPPHSEGQINFFDLTGVSSSNLPHIKEELIEVVEGRMLTDDEINIPSDNDIVPVFISCSIAEVNALEVGSVFTLSSKIVDLNQYSDWLAGIRGNLFAQGDFQFEIVGLFDTVVDREAEMEATPVSSVERTITISRHMDILNQIYVPNYSVEEIIRFQNSAFNEMDNENRLVSFPVSSLFILEDPLYIENFRMAVEPLLPDYIGIADFSQAFDEISGSMETFHQIADWILFLAVGATLLILSLLITLFLRDRRHEIGIYLALGEKKARIIFQILIEVVIIASIGITLAVFAGNTALTSVSQAMLRNELVELNNTHSATGRSIQISESGEVSGIRFMIPDTNSLIGRGFSFEMTPDELVEQFEISLSTEIIFLIYSVGLAVVIVSTLISIVYIVRLNPKNVLM